MDIRSIDSRSDSRHSSITTEPSKSSPVLHQYSCVRCRARKVKCDKIVSGCVHCRKVGAQCIYSARKSRKAHKLHRDLTVRPLLPTNSGAGVAGKSHDNLQHPLETIPSRDEHSTDNDEDDEGDRLIPRELQDASFEARFDVVRSEQGRLFVSQGRSRYINSGKASQLANFEKVLSAEPALPDNVQSSSSHASQVSPKPEQWSPKNTGEKLTSSSLLEVSIDKKSLRGYHPAPETRAALWEYYVCNVDMLVKIIYKPAVEDLIKRAVENLDRVDAAAEAFLFAIYFAAVTTMSAEECSRIHQESRAVLLHRYENALEQALSQAGWMTTQEVLVLQAMILLLVFTPRKNIRSIWMLVGAAMGIAQAMGMHRDSAPFALSVADIELRRRIWWTLCLFDNHISEDCGLEVHVPMTMDTKLPLHVNDSDIAADSNGKLLSRTDFTEMTISLIKLEMAEFSLRLKMSSYGLNRLSIDQMEVLAREKIQRYRDTYLQYIDPTVSHLHHLCHLGTRLIIANMWKIVHDHCRKRDTTTKEESEEVKEELLRYNTEVLEITHQLPDKSAQFGWFFGCKYTQWQAMAYLLIKLRHHLYGNSSALADRAWEVLDAVFRDFNDGKNSYRVAGVLPQKSKLWQSLLKLSERQRYLRKQTALQAQLLQQGSPDGNSSNLSALDSGYETNVSNEEHPVKQIPISSANATTTAPTRYNESVLLGDPFLGSIQDFEFDMAVSDETNWDKFDALVQNWQTDLVQQQEHVEYSMENPTITLGWW